MSDGFMVERFSHTTPMVMGIGFEPYQRVQMLTHARVKSLPSGEMARALDEQSLDVEIITTRRAFLKA